MEDEELNAEHAKSVEKKKRNGEEKENMERTQLSF